MSTILSLILIFRLTFSFSNKAVSDGAISFFLDHFVKTRVSRVTVGCFADPIYDPKDPEHVKREKSTHIAQDGEKRVRGHFYVILSKVNGIFSLLMAIVLVFDY